MCGRFALAIPRRQVVEAFGLNDFPDVEDRFNIAPSQDVEAVVVDESGRCVARPFHWGLVPFWAKDPKIGYKMINAKSETVFDKPAFRAAIRSRRCLVPAQGFYEWSHEAPGAKAPYFITLADGGIMALAGIFEHATMPDGRHIHSLAILTRDAAGVVRRLHDRQPVILTPDLHAGWLDPNQADRAEIEAMLVSEPPELTASPVGILVNNPRNQGRELIETIGPPLPSN